MLRVPEERLFRVLNSTVDELQDSSHYFEDSSVNTVRSYRLKVEPVQYEQYNLVHILL
jgi:hypothetical protein